jgi:hypothetical protein
MFSQFRDIGALTGPVFGLFLHVRVIHCPVYANAGRLGGNRTDPNREAPVESLPPTAVRAETEG